MRLFECIVNDGEDIYKTLVTAKNKKELLNVYSGNGDFEKIKDVTNEYFTEESVDCLDESLKSTGWGEAERKILRALLYEHIKGLKRNSFES